VTRTSAVRPSRRAWLLVVVAMAMLASSCGSPDEGADDKLRAAIRATEKVSRTFSYEEKAGSHAFAVEGAVEDDFRYTAKVKLNDSPLFEEVVDDDAVADRLLEADSIGFLALPGVSATPAAKALVNRQWVLDPTGAPVLLVSANTVRRLGDDPVVDSLTVFRYLELVLRQQRVVKFDKNSLEYRPQEDPFPTPKAGSDVIRYDFFPPKLPKASDTAGTANQAVPGPQHFRKMVVYVRKGRIIRVLEQFDVVGKLDELKRNYDLQPDPAVPAAKQAAIAIDAINVVRRGQGEQPIRPREMSLSLTKLGDAVKVALPAEATLTGDLSILRNRGKQARRATTSTTVPPGAATTTTTPSG
jgi:hypothetical protein